MGLVTSKYTLRSTSMYMYIRARDINTCSGCCEVRSGKGSSCCTSMLVRAVLVLLLAPLCLCAGKEPQSEERVYKTKEWKDGSRTLILTKQSSFDFMGSLISF